MAQCDRVRRADIDWLLIYFANVSSADDVRNNGEDDLIFRVILRSLSEEIFQDGDLGQAGNSAERFGRLIFHDSAEEVGFAILQADLVLDFSLSNDGLADAANVLLTGDGRNVHRHLEGDFPVACTCGVMSIFTPTSRYWNWVFTNGLIPTPPMPG